MQLPVQSELAFTDKGRLIHTFKEPGGMLKSVVLRATSHTRLRAHDHYTSSTLIGGKGGAGPSSLHTTLEGPAEYVHER